MKVEGFLTKLYDSQDQEELIMMMDFKDGAQRVILLLQPFERIQEKSTFVHVSGATETEGAWETRSVKSRSMRLLYCTICYFIFC